MIIGLSLRNEHHHRGGQEHSEEGEEHRCVENSVVTRLTTRMMAQAAWLESKSRLLMISSPTPEASSAAY